MTLCRALGAVGLPKRAGVWCVCCHHFTQRSLVHKRALFFCPRCWLPHAGDVGMMTNAHGPV